MTAPAKGAVVVGVNLLVQFGGDGAAAVGAVQKVREWEGMPARL